MRLAVVGGHGRTGREVVAQAVGRGHTVISVVRRPQPHPTSRGFREVQGDVLDAASLTEALAGAEAVISTVGIGSSRAPTTVYSQGTTNLLAAMTRHGIRRLAVVSAGAAGPRAEQPALNRWLVMPLLEGLYGASYSDMRRMEEVLRASGAAWTALRPPRLTEREATGHYHLDTHVLSKGTAITVGDLATALLDVLDRDALVATGVYVAN